MCMFLTGSRLNSNKCVFSFIYNQYCLFSFLFSFFLVWLFVCLFVVVVVVFRGSFLRLFVFCFVFCLLLLFFVCYFIVDRSICLCDVQSLRRDVMNHWPEMVVSRGIIHQRCGDGAMQIGPGRESRQGARACREPAPSCLLPLRLARLCLPSSEVIIVVPP